MAIKDGFQKQLKMNNNNVLVIAKLINVVKIARIGFSTNLISIGYLVGNIFKILRNPTSGK